MGHEISLFKFYWYFAFYVSTLSYTTYADHDPKGLCCDCKATSGGTNVWWDLCALGCPQASYLGRQHGELQCCISLCSSSHYPLPSLLPLAILFYEALRFNPSNNQCTKQENHEATWHVLFLLRLQSRTWTRDTLSFLDVGLTTGEWPFFSSSSDEIITQLTSIPHGKMRHCFYSDAILSYYLYHSLCARS